MPPFLAEFFGTMILIILGDGVVANTLLAKSKGEGGGWIVITTGWGLAVTFAVYAVGRFSGAHINPAVTISLAAIGAFPWSQVPIYIAAQLAGAFVGGVIVYLAYLPHWAETQDSGLKLAVFSTGPAVRNYVANIITEIIGTFILVLGILTIGANFSPTTMPNAALQSAFSTVLPPLLVGFLVWAIGLSLGGPTGYAINPARDLGPRVAHALLPIPGKGPSDWGYAWVPVVAPIIGGLIGAFTYLAFFSAR